MTSTIIELFVLFIAASAVIALALGGIAYGIFLGYYKARLRYLEYLDDAKLVDPAMSNIDAVE